jgi:RNA polymerase sigma factor (sigma-70 family)
MEDKLLVLKCKYGSKKALRRIYVKHKDALLILAVTLLNDTSAAEDVVHDVFTSFVRDIESFRLTGNLKGYLLTCVANKARNTNKAKYHRNTKLNSAEVFESDMNEPVNKLICNEQLEKLSNSMAKLPYDQREVIMLHFQTGMTFEEIAVQQGISVNTIKSRYRYGIEKMRAILDDEVIK